MCSQKVETEKRFVSYVRVSTQQQGRSGLGLEAQVAAVQAYASGRGIVVAEYREVETGKGADALTRRPQLKLALEACRKQKATLIIAKLDRLARNVHFVSGLIEAGCDFVAADMPEATKTMLQMHAVMSEWERDQISSRTKAALGAAKARGTKLGVAGPANLAGVNSRRVESARDGANKLSGIVAGFRARGLTQRAMVSELNTAGIGTPARGNSGWTLVQVQRLLARLDRPNC
jgi:DNA invertase Pin-like site-specific DNA recombinase